MGRSPYQEGVAAAEAAGKTLGCPAAFDVDQAADVVAAYAKGTAVKALAGQYGVAPKTIRRVLDVVGARDVGDGWTEQGGTIRRIRPREWARANELLPAAGVELDELSRDAIDNDTLGTALLEGLPTDVQVFRERECLIL